MERLAQVKRIAFDKTGTLTYGTPVVTAVKTFCPAESEEALFAAAASAELLSEHPLGKAIAAGCQKITGRSAERPEAFSMTLNVVAIVLAITGVLDPVVGALVHNAGSVLVIINSALLLNWRAKQ